jgi:hypothetical protein
MRRKNNNLPNRKIPKQRPQLSPLLDPSLSKTTCRVCLENKRTGIIPMEKENIFLVFKECTGFDVLLNGASAYMPTHICSKCKRNLLMCKAFLNQSKKTENILKEIYKCEEDRPRASPRAMQLFSSYKSKNENMKRTKMPSECPMDDLKNKKV